MISGWELSPIYRSVLSYSLVFTYNFHNFLNFIQNENSHNCVDISWINGDYWAFLSIKCYFSSILVLHSVFIFYNILQMVHLLSDIFLGILFCFFYRKWHNFKAAFYVCCCRRKHYWLQIVPDLLLAME